MTRRTYIVDLSLKRLNAPLSLRHVSPKRQTGVGKCMRGCEMVVEMVPWQGMSVLGDLRLISALILAKAANAFPLA